VWNIQVGWGFYVTIIDEIMFIQCKGTFKNHKFLIFFCVNPYLILNGYVIRIMKILNQTTISKIMCSYKYFRLQTGESLLKQQLHIRFPPLHWSRDQYLQLLQVKFQNGTKALPPTPSHLQRHLFTYILKQGEENQVYLYFLFYESPPQSKTGKIEPLPINRKTVVIEPKKIPSNAIPAQFIPVTSTSQSSESKKHPNYLHTSGMHGYIHNVLKLIL
jgi:hypothetical protein